MPVSIFGMFGLTRFIADSLRFTIPFSLASCRMMLAASPCPHGPGFTLTGSEFIVGAAPDTTVASHARTPKLLPEERQVLSSIYVCSHKHMQNNHLHDFMSHVLGSVGVEQDFHPVEHAQEVMLAFQEPFEQAVERREAGLSREDVLEPGPELGCTLSRGASL